MLRLPKDKPRSFIDIETTGFSTKKHEMIEFAALKHYPADDTVEALEYRLLPKHIETASPKALEVNGYSEKAWSDAVELGDVIGEIVEFLRGSVIIGHNIRFDTGFVKVAAKEHDAGRLPFHTIDTIPLCKEALGPEGLEKFDLGSVCDFLGISSMNAHTAMADVVRTKLVFDQLLEKLNWREG